MRRNILLVIAAILLFVEIVCIKAIPVVKTVFPVDKIEATLFTLTQNISGSQDFVLSLVLDICKTAILFVILTVAFIIFVKIISDFIKRKANSSRKAPTYTQLVIGANLGALGVFCYTFATQIPVFDYYFAWQQALALPEHSEFYQKEYIYPDSVKIEFSQKRNLILIFLESMEYNFQDSANGGNLSENAIPEITNYIKKEQSFIPGGAPLWGMGWTMADVVAKTCGIPLALPPSVTSSFKPLTSFLPGVKCLTDILIENEYNFIVSKGANLHFSGMSDFLNTHSKPQAYGLLNYTRDPRVKDATSEWGVRDSLHYEIIREHISKVALDNKPWALWMFTTDTHTPYGYRDQNCFPGQDIPESKQYPYVLKCSARILSNFIEWAKKQDWYANTTIAVMGDHAFMAAPQIAGFNDENITHYWLDFFIGSAKPGSGNKRDFSSLDFFPTILESIGANIPNGALGLGRSLYSSQPTLLEKYGVDSLNNALKKNSLEYNYFLYAEK